MKPTNKKEYNRSILGFFAMWAITTALIVFACLQPFKTPKLENAKLRKQVESLKKDSTQQHLLLTTIQGINSTMESLSAKYSEDTLKKLSTYPNEDLEDSEMKDKLEEMSGRIVEVVKLNSVNGNDLQKQLRDCNEKLSLKDEQISNLNIIVQQKESQINQLRYLNSQ